MGVLVGVLLFASSGYAAPGRAGVGGGLLVSWTVSGGGGGGSGRVPGRGGPIETPDGGIAGVEGSTGRESPGGITAKWGVTG